MEHKSTQLDSIKVYSYEEKTKDILKHLRNETLKLFLKAYQVKNRFLKFYIVVTLTLVTGISGYMVINLILNYLSFEVLNTTSSMIENPSVFPKVTICNFNQFQTVYALELLKSINMEINPNMSIFDTDEIKKMTFDEINYLVGAIYTRAVAFIISSNFSDEQRKKLAHDPSDTLLNCIFSNEICTASDDFIWYFDRNYGNCYVFNSGFDRSGKKVDLKMAYLPGDNGGSHLFLDYYVGGHENLTLFNSFAGNLGALILIENNSFLIDNSLGEQNIHLSPGLKGYIKTHRSFEYSLPKPYSNCDIPNDSQEQFVKTNFFYRLFAESPYQYTQQSCLIQCYQQNLIKNC